MKKAVYLVLFAGCLTATSCGSENQTSSDQSKSNTEQVAEKQYACPMKCEGEKTYDKAGECPKCHMDLEEVK